MFNMFIVMASSLHSTDVYSRVARAKNLYNLTLRLPSVMVEAFHLGLMCGHRIILKLFKIFQYIMRKKVQVILWMCEEVLELPAILKRQAEIVIGIISF